MSAVRVSPFQIHPRLMQILERYQVIFSYHIDEVFLDLWLTSDNIRPLLRTEWLVLWIDSPHRFSQGVLPSARRSWTFRRWQEHSMESAHLFFRPSQIVTILVMFLLLLLVQLVQQYLLSQLDEVLMFGDSTLILHRICQIPVNCQCEWLLVSSSAPRFFAFFLFPVKFLFYTDKTESIE